MKNSGLTPNVLKLSRQGNPNAIANLLNGQLRPKGVIATVTKDRYFDKEERLKIVFEYEQAKSREKILIFVQKFFQKINPESISSVMIYGRRKGNDASDWSGEIRLSQVEEIKKSHVKVSASSNVAEKSREKESRQKTKEENERIRQALLLDLELSFIEGYDAIERLNEAIEDFPDHVNFYYLRAIQYLLLDNKFNALNDCLNVLSKEPNHLNAQILEIKIKATLQLFDEVLHLTDSLIDHLSSVDRTGLEDANKTSSLSVAFFYRGFCKAHIENFESSLKDLRQSVLLDSESEVHKGATEMIKILEELGKEVGNEKLKILNISTSEELETAIHENRHLEEVKLESDVGLDFSRLQHLLKEQKFRQADKLTYDLMCEAIGKPIGSWFTDQDFQFFPETDLLTIDKLWAAYSNGKFGFSAQGKIYEECGGLYGSDYFYDRVGWEANPFLGQDFFKDEDMLDLACEGFLPYLCNAKGRILFIKNQFIVHAIQERFQEVS